MLVLSVHLTDKTRAMVAVEGRFHAIYDLETLQLIGEVPFGYACVPIREFFFGTLSDSNIGLSVWDTTSSLYISSIALETNIKELLDETILKVSPTEKILVKYNMANSLEIYDINLDNGNDKLSHLILQLPNLLNNYLQKFLSACKDKN